MMTAFNGTVTAFSRNVEQQQHFGRLSRQQYMVGVGHLGTHREGTGEGVDLRLGKVDQPFVGILGIVGQGDGDVGLPRTILDFLAEVHVTLFAAQVVEGGHAEIDQHRVALDDGGQLRLAVGTYQCTEVDESLADVTRL